MFKQDVNYFISLITLGMHAQSVLMYQEVRMHYENILVTVIQEHHHHVNQNLVGSAQN